MKMKAIGIFCTGMLMSSLNAAGFIAYSGATNIVLSGGMNANLDIAGDILNSWDNITIRLYTTLGNPAQTQAYWYSVIPGPGDLTVATASGQNSADNLSAGALVSSSLNYKQYYEDSIFFGWQDGGPDQGNFRNQGGYVGLQMNNGGTPYYGWLSIGSVDNYNDPNLASLQINGWAYENTPGTPIAAGAVPEPNICILMIAGIAMLAGSQKVIPIACAARRSRE